MSGDAVPKRPLGSLTKLERRWLGRRFCGWCETSALAEKCGAINGSYLLETVEDGEDVYMDLGPPCDMDQRRGQALLSYRPRSPTPPNRTDDGEDG